MGARGWAWAGCVRACACGCMCVCACGCVHMERPANTSALNLRPAFTPACGTRAHTRARVCTHTYARAHTPLRLAGARSSSRTHTHPRAHTLALALHTRLPPYAQKHTPTHGIGWRPRTHVNCMQNTLLAQQPPHCRERTLTQHDH